MATEKRIKIVVDSKGAKRKVDDLDNSMRGLGGTADRTTSGLSTLSRVATAVISAVAVQRVVAYADAFSELQTQLKLVTDSSAELNRTTQTLLKLSNDTASSLDGTVGIYTKLTRATEQLGASEEEILDVTRAINQSFVISGASAEEAANAIRQLNQGLASGVLRGEEFNAINENADRLARALADSLGVTRGELRALAAEGVLTTEKVFNALKGQAAAINDEFGQVDLTVGRAFSNLNDSLTVAVGRFDQATGASNSFAQAIDALSDKINDNAGAIEELGDNADTSLQIIKEAFLDQIGIVRLAQTASEQYTDATDERTKTLNQTLKETVSLYGQLANVTGLSPSAPVRVDQEGQNQSTGVLRSDAPAANEFAEGGQTKATQSEGERGLSNLRVQAQAEAAKAREELERQNQAAISAQFLQSEKNRTEILQNETERRARVAQAEADFKVDANASFFERLQAQRELEKEKQLARLDEERANTQIRFEERLQRVQENEQLQGEAKAEILAEIREQELEQDRIFQQRKTEIEREGANDRVAVNQQAENARVAALTTALSSAAGLLSQFASENKAAALAVIAIQKGLAIAQAIQNTKVAELRALAELGPIAGPPVAAKIATLGAINVGIIAGTGLVQAGQALAGGGSSSISGGAGGGNSQPPTVQQQEPPSQSSIFEIRGFSELAQRLSEFDPGEPLPAEIAQRLAISIESIRTLEGGTA